MAHLTDPDGNLHDVSDGFAEVLLKIDGWQPAEAPPAGNPDGFPTTDTVPVKGRNPRRSTTPEEG